MRAGVLVGALVGGLALLACSALFEDAVQCRVDGDCAAFSHARCDIVERVCVQRQTDESDAGAPPRLDGAALDGSDDASSAGDASDASVRDATRAEGPPVVTYLSDLTPTNATSGYGPYEKDTSNGELLAGDGVTITLNATTYQKGLGVHAPSEISYALGGRYTTFLADVGVDDEVIDNGTVVFQVLVDDVVVFDSGTMTGASATKNVNVSVAGMQVLKLVVTDAADGIASDHGDWAGARLVQ